MLDVYAVGYDPVTGRRSGERFARTETRTAVGERAFELLAEDLRADGLDLELLHSYDLLGVRDETQDAMATYRVRRSRDGADLGQRTWRWEPSW